MSVTVRQAHPYFYQIKALKERGDGAVFIIDVCECATIARTRIVLPPLRAGTSSDSLRES